jgi:hypothetical protein
VGGLVAGEVGGDRAVPVDVARPGTAAARRPVECAGDGRAGAVRDPPLDLRDDPGDDLAGGRLGRLRHEVVEAEQRADQVHIRLDRLEHLRLEQQLPEVEPVDRVPLHDLHDGGREIGADIAQPARHPRGGRGESGRLPARGVATGSLPAGAFVIERGQRRVDGLIRCGQTGAALIGRAEQQPPAP